MSSSSQEQKKSDEPERGEDAAAAVGVPSNSNPNPNRASADAATRATQGFQPAVPHDQHAMPNIQDLRPERRPGDFDGDLGRTRGGEDPSGMLMGPNHPAFRGADPPVSGGYGMRPRFDPFGPPGGPTDPRNLDPPSRNEMDPNDPRNQQIPRQPRPPPGGLGDPNPDHERPPSDLNNNMFM